jgi:purine catabolism regulator
VTGDSALPREHLHVLERAATVAALVITKTEAIAAVEEKYRSDFLRDVLTGRAGSTQRMLAHGLSLGWDLGRPAVVVVAEMDTPAEHRLSSEDLRDFDSRLTRAWTRAVYAADRLAPSAGFSDEVVALVPVAADCDHQHAAELVAKIATAVKNDRTASLPSTFSVGISRVVNHVEQLPRAYEHAQRAVAVGRKLQGEGALMAFDALGVFRLLSLIEDTSELTAFAIDTLGPFVTSPSSENDDLLRTLTVLLETGVNIAETARLLHFHYNTLRYRINKIESILGPLTTNPELRLRVLLALQVLEMRGA